jgi:hypothetical protein
VLSPGPDRSQRIRGGGIDRAIRVEHRIRPV